MLLLNVNGHVNLYVVNSVAEDDGPQEIVHQNQMDEREKIKEKKMQCSLVETCKGKKMEKNQTLKYIKNKKYIDKKKKSKLINK